MLEFKRCTAALAAAGLVAAVAALAFDYDDRNLRDPMVRWSATSTNVGPTREIRADNYEELVRHMSNLVASATIEAVAVGWSNALICINERILGVNRTRNPKPEELPFPSDAGVLIYSITTGEVVFIEQNVQYSTPALTTLPATQEKKKP